MLIRRVLAFSALSLLFFSFVSMLLYVWTSQSTSKVVKFPRHYVGEDIHAFSEPSVISLQDRELALSSTLSKFGSSEYECYGTCSCDSYSSQFDSTRRSFAGSVTRGISYVVVAASSLVAVDSAKRYFKAECLERLGSECDNIHSIHSEVENCEEVEPDPSTIVYKKFKGKTQKRYKGGRKYLCKGNCVNKNILRWKNKDTVSEVMERLKCESIEGSEKEVRIFTLDAHDYREKEYIVDFYHRVYVDLVRSYNTFTEEQFEIEAQAAYTKKHLRWACEEASEVIISEFATKHGIEFATSSEFLQEERSLCVAPHIHAIVAGRSDIRCRFIGSQLDLDIEESSDGGYSIPNDDDVIRNWDIFKVPDEADDYYDD